MGLRGEQVPKLGGHGPKGLPAGCPQPGLLGRRPFKVVCASKELSGAAPGRGLLCCTPAVQTTFHFEPAFFIGRAWSVDDILTEDEEEDKVPLQKLQLLSKNFDCISQLTHKV